MKGYELKVSVSGADDDIDPIDLVTEIEQSGAAGTDAEISVEITEQWEDDDDEE